MCLSIPHKIVAIKEDDQGEIEIDGIRQSINLSLVPEAKTGDYVLAYCGSAVAKVEEDEVEEIALLFEEMSAGLFQEESNG